jgi:hypothetical protein
MEIQTKYNIGDKVWIMRNDKPEQILISNIEVEIIGETITGTGGMLSGKCYTHIYYIEIQRKEYRNFGDKEPIYRHNERDCFPTKKDLLNSFLEDEE